MILYDGLRVQSGECGGMVYYFCYKHGRRRSGGRVEAIENGVTSSDDGTEPTLQYHSQRAKLFPFNSFTRPFYRARD